MPIYHFDIADAHPPIACEGVELESVGAARCQALRYAGQILCEQPEAFWDNSEWTLTVSDENHLTLFSVVIGTVVAPAMQAGLRSVG
jgi:hypothetical protein